MYLSDRIRNDIYCYMEYTEVFIIIYYHEYVTSSLQLLDHVDTNARSRWRTRRPPSNDRNYTLKMSHYVSFQEVMLYLNTYIYIHIHIQKYHHLFSIVFLNRRRRGRTIAIGIPSKKKLIKTYLYCIYIYIYI